MVLLRAGSGNYYERNLATGVVTKYYYANGQRACPERRRRVAMRQGSTIYYFTGDHLGSTSLMTNASGGEVSRQKYFPYGAPRSPNPSTLPTDYRFTGQRSEEAALGSLYDYNARFYSPALGRFLSPDTFVQNDGIPPAPVHALTVSYANPSLLNGLNERNRSLRQSGSRGNVAPADPQFLNRYSYVRNNPLVRVDPGGNLAWFVAPLAGGALIGGATSTAAYVAMALATGQEITPGGLAGAAAGGAIAGVVSVFATPLAGSALKLAGMAATNTALSAGAAMVNAAGGATAYLAGGAVENAANALAGKDATFKPSVGGAALNAVTAGALNVGLSKAFPVDNGTMRTLKQAEHFMAGRKADTIKWSRLIPGNAQNLYWGQTRYSVLYGALAGAGINKMVAQ